MNRCICLCKGKMWSPSEEAPKRSRSSACNYKVLQMSGSLGRPLHCCISRRTLHEKTGLSPLLTFAMLGAQSLSSFVTSKGHLILVCWLVMCWLVICWLVTWQLNTICSPLGRQYFSWGNHPNKLSCSRANGSFPWLAFDVRGPS